jgi:MFS family permease
MTSEARLQACAETGSAKRIYYHLFAAQVIALVGTGVATVALALLAYRLRGDDAGIILGVALAIKMLAAVLIAPFAGALADRLPRRGLLAGLDLVRGAIVLVLPFVTQVWEIYVLIFLFQAASAVFAPVCQSTIPDILVREEDYTRALSRSRLAYELENLASPVIAAGLLLLLNFTGLFVCTMVGFLVSAVLILRVTLPERRQPRAGGFLHRTVGALRAFLATGRLRGLSALNLVAAAASSMATVNTVVIVQAHLDLGARATALALVAFGAGSVAGALAVPGLLARWSYRRTMLTGGILAAAGLGVGVVLPGYVSLLILWVGLGIGCSLAMTPAGALLLRSAAAEDRQSAYATQFALSHACLVVTYPLAGWLGSALGMPATFAVFAVIAGAAVAAAAVLWPRDGAAAGR